MDVYLECNIRANPRVYKVIWRHNGRNIYNNASAGKIVSNQTLVLQSVVRGTSGLYTCLGSNSEGKSESRAFKLDVKYEPVCTSGQQRVYGAARLEKVEVSCDVDANPPVTMFRWSFNNSAVQSLEVGAVTSVPSGGRSVASHTPRGERDYGTLLCWGWSELGTQRHPCVFHIVPAGIPDPPKDCMVVNLTVSSLQISCTRSFDGGLPQEFTLELYGTSTSNRRLVLNVTSNRQPEFTVTGLEPGSSYLIVVYSSNGKGRSEEVVTLRANTLGVHQQEHGRITANTDLQPFPEVTPILWLLAAIVSTLGLLGVAIVTIWRVRSMGGHCCELEDDQQSSTESPQSDTSKMLTVSLSAMNTPVTKATEYNPDVIRHTNEADSTDQGHKTVKKKILASNTQPASINPSVQTMRYANIQGYSRCSNKASSSCEAPTVRWQQVIYRDPNGQSQAQQVQVLRAIPVVVKVPVPVLKQNAGTQTSLQAQHKESTV